MYLYIYIHVCFLLVYSQLFHSISKNIYENHHKFTIKITNYFELDFLIHINIKNPKAFFPFIECYLNLHHYKDINSVYMKQWVFFSHNEYM